MDNNEEVFISDDEDDMNDHFFFAKDFQYFCNTTVSKHCHLKYQLQAMSNPKKSLSKVPERNLISYESVSWPAIMYGFLNSNIWNQLIVKVMDVKPTMERNTQLEVTLYKKLFESLQNMASTTAMNTSIASKLEERLEARNKVLDSYSNAIKNMERRIERDQALLLEDGENPTTEKRFQTNFLKRIEKLQLLRVMTLGFVSFGNLNYIESPEYILIMKKYKKKFTAESILDAVRTSNDDDDLSSSLSAPEQ